MILPLIIPHGGGGGGQNTRGKVGGRLAVTLADEIWEVAETNILSDGTFRLPILRENVNS